MNTLGSHENALTPVERSNLLQKMISPGDVVLDLGSFASGTTQALLSRRCRCYVEDLPLFLNEIQVHDDFNFERALREHLVIANDEVRIGVILTWDLFHYLDLSEIRALFSVLESKIGPGTIIHSTRYMGQDIPERPQLFKLSEDLSYKMLEEKSSLKVPNYSHATINLLTELKHFSLNDTLTHSRNFNKDLVEYSLIHSGNINKMRPVRPVSFDLKKSSELNELRTLSLPNLNKLLGSLLHKPKDCVADLGGSLYSNYDQLIRTADIVLQEDLYSSILWLRKTSIGEQSRATENVISFRESVKLDLVLLWDIANFCQGEELSRVVKKLTKHLSMGALLHFVLPHAGKTAVKPANFKLNNRFETECQGELNGQAGHTVLTTGQLVRLLPGFKVQAYYFGTQADGSNYQEYIFEFIGKS